MCFKPSAMLHLCDFRARSRFPPAPARPLAPTGGHRSPSDRSRGAQAPGRVIAAPRANTAGGLRRSALMRHFYPPPCRA